MNRNVNISEHSIPQPTGDSNQSQAETRVAIIGGGVTGLSAAYDLTRQQTQGQPAPRVTIYESSETLGGLAAGFKGRPAWEWPLEHFYHHLFTNDDAIISLTKEIGLADALETYRPSSGFQVRGKNYALDSARRLLTFPLIPFMDRIRMGMVIAYLKFHPRPPWRQFDRMKAHEWGRRWMGERAWNAAWEFQLESKFGRYAKDVNMAWLWARVYKRTPSLIYYRGGFQAFVDKLVAQVRAENVTIHVGTPVQAITPHGNQFTVVANGQEAAPYDKVLSTVSPELMQRLTPELPDAYLGNLQQLKSMGAVVMTVALDRQLLTDGMYWVGVAKSEGVPFLALVEHTNMVDPAHYGGDHLIYLGDYLDPTHRYFAMNVAELLDEFLPHLTRFNPKFERSWVTGAWVHKAKYAQPVPPVGYADMIPDIRTPLRGLYFASMNQVYPWDRGTNYAVEMGRRVAGMMTEDL